MKTYFSTFVSGTGEIIKRTLEKRGPDKFNILLILDGLVVYKTKLTERDVRRIRFFNNSFVLFQLYKKLDDRPLEGMVELACRYQKLGQLIADNLPAKKFSFRIVTSLENQTVAVNRALIEKLEARILQNNNLRLNIREPDKEFWFIARSEGSGFFGIRITYPYYKDAALKKGQLRPELAHILSLVSQPSPKDIILDPFAGSGAIPLERASHFPYKRIIALEKDIGLVRELEKVFREAKKKIEVVQGNALKLEQIPANSIDKIITDPPWGIYEKTELPLDDFYQQMLAEFHRVLNNKGIVVLLIGNIEIFDNILVKNKTKWILGERYNILVSGKKATIYKLQKLI